MQTAAHPLAEFEDGGIGDEVVDVQTLLAASDDAGFGQGLEMPGHVGLGGLRRRHQLRDVALAGFEGDEQAEAHGLAEDPEPGGDEFDGLIGKLLTFHGGERSPSALDGNYITIYAYRRRGQPCRAPCPFAIAFSPPMKLENAIRVLAGSMVLLSLALHRWVDPRWLWLAVFVGANLIQSAFTGFCPAANILRKLGVGKEDEKCCS